MDKHDIQERAMERAEKLAHERHGCSFEELEHTNQDLAWRLLEEAEQGVRGDLVDAAELCGKFDRLLADGDDLLRGCDNG